MRSALPPSTALSAGGAADWGRVWAAAAAYSCDAVLCCFGPVEVCRVSGGGGLARTRSLQCAASLCCLQGGPQAEAGCGQRHPPSCAAFLCCSVHGVRRRFMPSNGASKGRSSSRQENRAAGQLQSPPGGRQGMPLARRAGNGRQGKEAHGRGPQGGGREGLRGMARRGSGGASKHPRGVAD